MYDHTLHYPNPSNSPAGFQQFKENIDYEILFYNNKFFIVIEKHPIKKPAAIGQGIIINRQAA